TKYGLLFLIRQATSTRPPLLLHGTYVFEPQFDFKPTALDPTKLTARELDALLEDTFVYWTWDFCLAIQCKARAWDPLAQAILYKMQREELAEHAAETKATIRPPLKSLLAKDAWDYWEMQLSEPGTDWASIARRLKSLHAAEVTLETAVNRRLLESLDA